MREIVLRLNESLERDLMRLAVRLGLDPSEVALDLLRRQLSIEELKRLRKAMRPYAEARGYFTDEDVFRDVS